VLTRAEIFALILAVILVLVSIFGILSKLTQKYGIEQPAFGGTLREGIVGNIRFINPLLVQTDADRDLASLIYAGLMRHDSEGNLVPLLAKKYAISETGLEYIFTLKEGLLWSDGKPLMVDDVIFTVQLAKNPLVQSTRRPNWEGVEIEKINDLTLKFHLRKTYVPFLENLTLGILPKHLWENVPPAQFALVELNTKPVGAGPYKIKSIKRDSVGSVTRVALIANKHFAAGKPNIKNLILQFYNKEGDVAEALKRGFLDSLGALSPNYIKTVASNNKIHVRSINLQRIIAVFLNKDALKSLESINVRRALNLATDKKLLVEKVLKGYGVPINGPLPTNILPREVKEEPEYDRELAKSLIKKTKAEVELTITTANAPELVESAELLKEMWEQIGVKVDVKAFELEDLEQLVIGPRRYNAFIYGEEVVGQNPDLFAFWHSSQRAHPGYNIALYANSKTDKLLEAVRAEQDPEKRAGQYLAIQKEIQKDLPAIFLFSPHYIYLTPKNLGGMDIKSINTGSERFSTIHEWYLKKKYVWKIFAGA